MTDLPTPAVPSVPQLYLPTLRTLDALGGSGTVGEIVASVIFVEGYSDEIQSAPHTQGTRTKLEYRLAWARTHLRIAGAVENSERGVWALTDEGRRLLKLEAATVVSTVTSAVRDAYPSTPASDDEPEPQAEADWQEQLLGIVLELTPDQFERLAARVLREAGFTSVTVTGRSGDGGIDGIGVLRVSLLSFQVYFQCKRYRAGVGAGAVRDFRGAMSGRGDKGLLITTSSFTPEAQRESTRDGAPPVDLIDGEALCELLKKYRLGVEVTTRTVDEAVVVPDFFQQF